MMGNEVHRQLADVLGIDYRGKPVTGFDVRARLGEPVRVTVHQAVTGQAIDTRATLFRLEALDAPVVRAPRFDLERMCKEARDRIWCHVEERAHAMQHQLRTAGRVRAASIGVRANVSAVQYAVEQARKALHRSVCR